MSGSAGRPGRPVQSAAGGPCPVSFRCRGHPVPDPRAPFGRCELLTGLRGRITIRAKVRKLTLLTALPELPEDRHVSLASARNGFLRLETPQPQPLHRPDGRRREPG